ncbi:MAG TPA: hypothetical protein VD837_00020 [Terriglobales bacterium]|nr:hypothetical protein [Terriglobales bacterium]
MSEENDTVSEPSPESTKVDVRYVAFCDILGFSNRVLADFDGTLEVYQQFGAEMASFSAKEVQATMYSDAILITATSLAPALIAVQHLWFLALTNDLMIRGAITKGRYWEQRQGNHLLVASDALVRAVKLEKAVGVPAVVIADDIDIPDTYWLTRFAKPFETALLHFRDRNIVNPFNTMWGASAANRASILMAESPEHRDKYLWFLALHKAVQNGQELIPPDVYARFVRDGILKPVSTGPQQQERIM